MSTRGRTEEALTQRVLKATGARGFVLGRRVQSLWGGYGELWCGRLETERGVEPVVVKDVRPPADDGSLAHRRKLRSYRVEQTFYARFAGRLGDGSRTARLLGQSNTGGELLMVLEDLEQAGFSAWGSATAAELSSALGWLASFHASFLGVAPGDLWKVGTYWHLGTRPDELARMRAGALRAGAAAVDERLSSARFRTFVHGDAKPDNMGVASDGRVAFVDFQYVGGGVGVKDVAYLLNCCVAPSQCVKLVPRYLDEYFAALRAALGPALEPNEVAALEREWRELFPVAWVDFYRFLLGWAPAYAAGDTYSQKQLELVLKELR